MTEQKELWFFYADDLWAQGPEWYSRCFTGHGGATVAGEVTPLYYADPEVLQRMASVVPDCKLLLMLRDPVARAVSHYWFNVKKSKEPLSFAAAVAADLARERPWKLSRGACNYATLGMYDRHLENVYRHFPQEQVYVVVFEDMLVRPEEIFSGLWRFLGVADQEVHGLPRRNSDSWLRSRGMSRLYADSPFKRLLTTYLPGPLARLARRVRDAVAFGARPTSITEEDLARLTEVYRPHVAALEEILGRPLDAWLRPAVRGER